jgi:hypothetical protein
MNRNTVLCGLVALLAGIASCSKEAPPPPPPAPKVEAPAPPPAAAPAPAVVSVANVQLGNAIGADKKVTAPSESFAKNDTIYAVVETTGTGTATLKAKWTYHKGADVAQVNEGTQTINATGPAVSEFHISKPDGWPAGDYQVEISVNDKSAGTKRFKVN